MEMVIPQGATPPSVPPVNYFSTPRLQALPLLPPVSTCLEVGCGNGATLRVIKERNPAAWLAGIELEPDQARHVQVDQVLVGDVESVDLSRLRVQQFDAILCLDILEHLRDPWAMTKKLAALLRPGGVMIASIPNIQHYSILLGLLRGRWTYASSGLLDRTHLRFFVRSTAIQLFRDAGLTPVAADTNCSTILGLANAITGRAFEGILTYQYLIKSIKGPAEWEHRSYWQQVSAQVSNFAKKLKAKFD